MVRPNLKIDVSGGNKTAVAINNKTGEKEIIEDFHEIMANYNPENNTTRNIMTRYEKNSVVGLRTEQLRRGAEPLVEFDETKFNPLEIAERELKERKIPMIIKRKLPNGKMEYWRMEDLIIL